MYKQCCLVLALASAVQGASVINYDPGTGYAPRYTNVNTVLGEPSRVNPFGDPTAPFNPAYGTNQILSIGAGGSLTVQFQQPVLNHPNNIFGLDFTIFGNSGFIITNAFDPTTFEWIGTPATDGSLFGQNTGSTRVLVSRDGTTFYELDPSRAPTVDVVFPTDGVGHFGTPVDPTLSQEDFAGLTLEQIRALYNGSAGGASYDISWAQDAEGNAVFLPEINFIRVEVLSGKAEIDGFVTVTRRTRARHMTGIR
jgi:hypothetical protein